MQAWRRAYGDDVALVCICVDGRPVETAREFRRLYFDDTMTNGFIDDPRDFPTFPAQLGCQGLVVLDAKGRFATQRSPAFLEYRHQAFRAVEAMLVPLIAAAPPCAERGRAATTPRQEEEKEEETCAKGASKAPKSSRATFSENACCDAPTPLDEEADPAYALPPVDHDDLDADHAVISALMRAVTKSNTAADLIALRDEFLAHAAREEAIVRAAEQAARGGSAPGTTSSFEASDSHAADHVRIAGMATAAAAGAAAPGRADGLVSEAAVRGVCRAILEHAATFDALAARTIAAGGG